MWLKVRSFFYFIRVCIWRFKRCCWCKNDSKIRWSVKDVLDGKLRLFRVWTKRKKREGRGNQPFILMIKKLKLSCSIISFKVLWSVIWIRVRLVFFFVTFTSRSGSRNENCQSKGRRRKKQIPLTSYLNHSISKLAWQRTHRCCHQNVYHIPR